jgi:hypothetical protein
LWVFVIMAGGVMAAQVGSPAMLRVLVIVETLLLATLLRELLSMLRQRRSAEEQFDMSMAIEVARMVVKRMIHGLGDRLREHRVEAVEAGADERVRVIDELHTLIAEWIMTIDAEKPADMLQRELH